MLVSFLDDPYSVYSNLCVHKVAHKINYRASITSERSEENRNYTIELVSNCDEDGNIVRYSPKGYYKPHVSFYEKVTNYKEAENIYLELITKYDLINNQIHPNEISNSGDYPIASFWYS